MNTTLTVGARLSALLFILFFYSTAFAKPVKVDVCHIPPSDPENFHTIRIKEEALGAHLAHGDFAGACNQLCATLCDDGNACTVDDTLDCEEQGCPAFPREAVDCSDGLSCTTDSCDVEDGCFNDDLCVPTDSCHVSVCSEEDDACAETPVVCGTGEACDLGTGECVPEAVCPCFTLEELQAGGDVAECGENFPGFPDLAAIFYSSGVTACSGLTCADTSLTVPSCAYNSIVTGISEQEDSDCRALILQNCANPNQPSQASPSTQNDAPPMANSAFIDQ
jgi:hypothetical protein